MNCNKFYTICVGDKVYEIDTFGSISLTGDNKVTATESVKVKEPDSYWSFKATPKKADLERILREAQSEGLRAVAIDYCGIGLTAYRSSQFVWPDADTPDLPSDGEGSEIDVDGEEWWVNVLKENEDPFQLLSEALAEYDAWANKKARIRVAGYR